MTQSRFPRPSCPYNSWPLPLISSVIELGATNSAFAGMLNPVNSTWESLTQEQGYYLANQAYRGGSLI